MEGEVEGEIGCRAGWTDRVDGWTDPARTDREAALTEMNESRKWRVSGNIRSGAAGVPDTLLPLTGLSHAAASPRRGGTATSSDRKRQAPIVVFLCGFKLRF